MKARWKSGKAQASAEADDGAEGAIVDLRSRRKEARLRLDYRSMSG